jgi:catecholate siderophore receptor
MTSTNPPAARRPRSTLLPLGALATGFGLAGAAAAQATAPAPAETVMPVIRASASAEPSAKDNVLATTTRIGKAQQELRDVPQSVTVVTEKLINDRNLDTLKDALRNTAGISFLAAEGGEEDIRLRGFSLQSTGDIFVDGIRDPAFYDRDSFNWDRLEVLRGSASMLFGRGSTGGAANQVSKLPRTVAAQEVELTVGSGSYRRLTGDFNLKTGDNAALRVNAMATRADNHGEKVDKKGIAPAFRWGIGTAHEFLASAYWLENGNNIHYGIPWLTPATGSTDRVLVPIDAKNFYGMASDQNDGSVKLGTFGYTHRFADRSEWRTVLRLGQYERDLRASAIRFAAANLQPGGQAVTLATLSPDTVLTRGTQLKVQDLDTRFVQSDYSTRFNGLGGRHEVQAGVDAGHEDFNNDGLALPTGVTLVKPTTRIGTPDDGARIDESLRIKSVNRTFDARSMGVYAQDLLQVAPAWKLLAGLRWDRFEGEYRNINIPAAANNVCAVPVAASISRSDSLFSHRLGVLYQPTAFSSFHASYGTSFNTAGDAYQYDAGNAQVDPESSRNFEIGAKLDLADGNLSTRVAVFHSTKYNERNRDAETVNACNYVLSGQRHAAGIELDVAGRITPAWEMFVSLSFIPDAEVDAASAAAPAGETVGARPGLTPRFSGTLWTTYQLSQKFRIGAGINTRSSDAPQGITSFKAPSYVTGDLMAEYAWDGIALKANLSNVTDKLYADGLYRGHYIPGKPRTLQVTATYQF